MTQLHLPQFDKLNLPNQRIIVLLVGLLVGLYVVWWGVMFFAFDEEVIRRKTLNALSHHLGAQVDFAGETTFSLMPVPELTVRNLQVKNSPRARHHNMVQIPQASVKVHPYSLLSDNLIVQLELYGARVELETFPDDSHSWVIGEKEVPMEGGLALIEGMHFKQAQIHYMDPSMGRDIVIQVPESNVSFTEIGEVDLAGVFVANETYYQYQAVLSGDAQSTQNMSVSLTDGVSHLKAEGSWDPKQSKLEAVQTFESADFAHFLEGFLRSSRTPSEEVAEENKIPMNIQGKLTYEDNRFLFSDVKLEGPSMHGKGLVNIRVSDKVHVGVHLEYDIFDIGHLVDRGVFLELVEGRGVNLEDSVQANLPTAREVTLPKDVAFDIFLKAKESKLLGVTATDMQIVASMNDQEVAIKQFNAKLPGNTTFVIKGGVEGSLDGMALKGEIDIVGNHFPEFSDGLFGQGIEFPEPMKRFRGKANLFLNPAVLRLSEGVFRLEGTQLIGTMIRHRDLEKGAEKPRYRYEGAFRLDNMNIDEWIAVQPEVQGTKLAEYHPFIRKLQKLTSYKQNSTYHFKVNMKDFHLNGQQRSRAGLDVKLQPTYAALTNIQTSYNGTYLQGDIGVRFLKGKKPYISAQINADHVDVATFLDVDFEKERPFWRGHDGDWSKEQFDVSLLDAYDGEVELNFGAFSHRIWDLSDVHVKASVKDSILQVDSFETGVWAGKFTASGRLRAGKLPTLKGRFALQGMLIDQLHDITDFFGNLSGRVTLKGDVTTSGSNMFYFVQNAQGSMSVAGRGLTIDGFNLANMVRAANTVRTVSDIEKLIAFADQGGETTIDAISGTMNLNGGVLRTPGSRIATRVGNGSINGQVNIMESTLNMALIIYLSALQQTNPPNIRLVFVGPLHNATRTLDTQSLESFIAKQAAERLLDNR